MRQYTGWSGARDRPDDRRWRDHAAFFPSDVGPWNIFFSIKIIVVIISFSTVLFIVIIDVVVVVVLSSSLLSLSVKDPWSLVKRGGRTSLKTRSTIFIHDS